MHLSPDTTDARPQTGPERFQYTCDRTRLAPVLADRFVQLSLDDDGQHFIDTVGARPHGWLRRWAYRGLRQVMSDFDAHGLLGMYGAHLLSTAQLGRLLGRPGAGDNGEDGATRHERPEERLEDWLDVGAGNGDTIEAARPLVKQLHATEASRVMRGRLAARGLQVHDVDLCVAQAPGPFDVVSCLHVLDRCLYPRTMLEHARAALRPGGQLLVALPLPLRPHVDLGRHSVDQEQPLPSDEADSWEQAATRLWEHLLQPAGLRLQGLARVPYLTQGDDSTDLHVLDDAVFVCQAVP